MLILWGLLAGSEPVHCLRDEPDVVIRSYLEPEAMTHPVPTNRSSLIDRAWRIEEEQVS